MTPPATFVLIGHPVSHSLSPAIHQAAYDELGLAGHRYVAVDCPDDHAVRAQLAALRRGEVAGANVTVPWKRFALESADEVHASAEATGAANVLCPEGASGSRRLVAHNTDVPALMEELAAGSPAPRTATIIGSGGAALAAVAACRALGAERVAVVARRFRAGAPSWPEAAEFVKRGGTPVAWPSGAEGASPFRDVIAESDVVVQSTSDGMSGASDGSAVRDLVPWDALPRGAFVYDVVYNPAVTPIVRAARAAGLRAETGLGMLVGQAALAIELWLGRRADRTALRTAAERALASKTR